MKLSQISYCFAFLFALTFQMQLSAQDKYKQYSKENKAFHYQGGLTLSFNNWGLSDSATDDGYNHSLVKKHELQETEAIGIYSNFIYKFIGAHLAFDFIATPIENPSIGRFKKFDIGPIVKLKFWDFSFGFSRSKFLIEETNFKVDKFSGYKEFINSNEIADKASGFFVGSGISLGPVRLDAKFHHFEDGDSLTNQFLRRGINGFTIGLGVSL